MPSASDLMPLPCAASSVAEQRAVLRGAVTGATAWGKPPPKMSWRLIFLVAFLQAVASVGFLRWAVPSGPDVARSR